MHPQAMEHNKSYELDEKNLNEEERKKEIDLD